MKFDVKKFDGGRVDRQPTQLSGNGGRDQEMAFPITRMQISVPGMVVAVVGGNAVSFVRWIGATARSNGAHAIEFRRSEYYADRTLIEILKCL